MANKFLNFLTEQSLNLQKLIFGLNLIFQKFLEQSAYGLLELEVEFGELALFTFWRGAAGAACSKS